MVVGTMMGEDDGFEQDDVPRGGALVLDLDGFEGPLDVLLALARTQKVDLVHISILELAEQYLAFIEEVRQVRLELAADYLVMAAWLAYLKSRLLLPDPAPEDEPGADEMAAALTHRLRQLEAMRDCGDRLMRRHRLGRDVFARGQPEGIRLLTRTIYEATLHDLLSAYAVNRRRVEDHPLTIEAIDLYSIRDALERITSLLGQAPAWASLATFLPPGLRDGLGGRAALAATLAASLELAREGRLQLRQGSAFGPIYVRRTPDQE